MKKYLFVFVAVLLMISMLSACGGSKAEKETVVDFADAASFEAALNNGDDLTGKTVSFVVREIVPDSAFGYNLITGEHLNFCASKNPGVKVGDTVTVKVTEIQSVLGSYVISYEILK